MSTHPFWQIDVFGAQPYRGNPVAVVGEAGSLTDDQMRAISVWTNLSECTFLVPPRHAEADYAVRIFSLDHELPFAGHPTLGSARAWLKASGVPRQPDRVVQECPAGLVPVRLEPGSVTGTLAFAAPPLVRSGPVQLEYLAQVCGVLGVQVSEVVDAAWVDNGPGWVGVLLADAARVLQLRPAALSGSGRFDIGVVGLYPEGSAPTHEVRAFFSGPDGSLREDPVTGSLNASLAQWLIETGRLVPPFSASQGAVLGRSGRIEISQDDAGLWVGGSTSVLISGSLRAP